MVNTLPPPTTSELINCNVPMVFVLPLDEIYAWLHEEMGPMAAEVLAIVAACVCEDGPGDSTCPPAFRRLYQTLTRQGMRRDDAEDLMREAYGRLTNHLTANLPEWSELEHYHGLQHSMRGHQTLVISVQPEPPRVKAYA